MLRDEETIVAARVEAEALLADDPDLSEAPVLGRAVAALAGSIESAFMEKS